MDVDEYHMWRILNMWVKESRVDEDEKEATARALTPFIQFQFIDPVLLINQVKRSTYIEDTVIEEALEQIALIMENESPEDKEHVLVEGAGDDNINGIYVLAEEEVGLDTEEVMFLKEGDEDGSGDFGLFCWGEKWAISSCTDYFNVLYSVDVSFRKGHSTRKPPKWGWKCIEGIENPPTCTWKPSKKEGNNDRDGIAPRLSQIKRERKGHTDASARSCGHAVRESLTLADMMALPEDKDVQVDDYRSMARELDAMMNLPVDDDHDNEEGGYDVNYLSATLCYNPSTRDLSKEPGTLDEGPRLHNPNLDP